MKLVNTFTTAAMLATVSATAGLAQDYKGRVSAGISTFGATVEGAYKFRNNMALRGMAAGLVELSPTISYDGTDYDTTLGTDDLAFGAMVDFYPMQSLGLRVSGGLVFGNVAATGSATATVANPITIGSTTLTGNEVVAVTNDFANDVSPMLSVGYELPIANSQWVVSAEVGALFNGGYDTDVTVTGGATAVAADQIQAEVDRIKNDIPDINVYPYVSVMVGIRF